MRKVYRGWKRLLFAAGALVVGATSLVAGAGMNADAASEIHAVAGGGEAGIAVNVFSPASLAVTVGDTVTWTNPYTEPHSVAFVVGDEEIADAEGPFNPEVAETFDGTETFSSGLFASEGMFAAAGDTFSVTFTEKGQYTFFCTIHPGMEVEVTVLSGGFVPPISESAVEKRIETGIDLGLAAAAAIEVPGPTTASDGTKVWTVPTPPSLPYEGGAIDVLRFTPPEVNIGVGDTVTWLNDSFTPHTVTFFVGPPPAGFSPFVPDVSSTDYEPGTFLNSGIYVNEALTEAFGGVGDSFSLTFNTAGAYQYLCALHADSGMVGIINVGSTSGGGGITPPSTGDAGLMDRGSGSWMMLAGVAVLLSSLGFATVVAVRKDA